MKAGANKETAGDVPAEIYLSNHADYLFVHLKIIEADYTVKHMLQKNVLSKEYVLRDTDSLSGYVSYYTKAEVKDYSGYLPLPFDQVKIKKEGTVVEIRYDLIYSTITFHANGHGTAPKPISEIPGEAIIVPENPSAEGYTFGGWYTEAECINRFVFRTMPAEDRMLYAKWSPVYTIIKGANQTILKNETPAGFVSDAPFDKFVRVEVDGKKISSKYYTAKSGSTVITFSKEYIPTLTEGMHTLRIVSADGSATTEFYVESMPRTGDNSRIGLWLALLACAGAVLMLSVRTKKRNEE